MKSPFLQPRFDGARFAEHTLPLDVARDLAAYETLVVELAKHIYIQEHSERQRVPKGFAADFHLHLERMDNGSSKPLLSVVMSGALPMPSEGQTYFERARDLIANCIAAPEGQLPADFPRMLLAHFNQVGRSLREDERMELPGSSGVQAVLTPARRKHLVLAAETVYERDVELSGTIGEADWEKSTFRLRLPDGGTAVIPMPTGFHSQAREFGGRSRHQVTVRGIGTFDSWDRLQRVISVESVEIQSNYLLAGRFESLTALRDGWLDGKGLAPEKAKLALLSERLVGDFPEDLPVPAIAPTPEGNLLLEWSVPGDPSVDLDLASLNAEFHAFQPDGSEIERQFALANDSDWRAFFSFLSSRLQSPSA